MKIAVVASLLKAISPNSTGGTEMFAHLLTEGLVDKGMDVTLFATSDSQTKAKLESVCSSNQTTGVYEGDLDTRIPYQIFQTGQIIKQSNQFDVIHNNYFHFFILTSLSKLTDIPIITTMHNHYWQLPNLKSILTNSQKKGKDIVVFASEAARSQAQGLFETEVIYHGIDPALFPFSRESEDYFLWLSRISPSKGIKDALDAAFRGNFSLIVGGGQPIKEAEKTYFSVSIEPYFTDKVKYVGAPSEVEKVKLYQKAKALLFPTHLEEQFGLVLIEAMSCGTPIIAYNHGAVSEVIKDGVTGFIIDQDDTPRTGKGSWIIKKKGVEGLIEATKRIDQIDRNACRKHVEDHFSKDRMVDDYIKLYNRVAK